MQNCDSCGENFFISKRGVFNESLDVRGSFPKIHEKQWEELDLLVNKVFKIVSFFGQSIVIKSCPLEVFSWKTAFFCRIICFSDCVDVTAEVIIYIGSYSPENLF